MRKFEYKSLLQLQKEKGSSLLTYAEKLSTLEWKKFRTEILNRDNSVCTCCGKKEFIPDELDSFRDRTEQEKSEFLEKTKKEFLNSKTGKEWMRVIGGLPKFGIPMIKKENYKEPDSVILHVHHKYYIKGKNPWEYNSEALITVCSKCHSKIHKNEEILVYENENLENPKVAEKCLRCSGTGYLGQFHYVMNGVCFKCHGIGITD